METNVNYKLVGAFVLILTTALVFAIIWLSSGFSWEIYSTYLVYMQESVAGLTPDSPVEYNGVTVGAVKKVALNTKNPQLVELTLNIETNIPITRGTTATLNTRGITGITYIALKDKSDDLRPLEKLPGQKYPVIKTAPSLFLRLDTALSQFMKDFRQVSASFQKVFDDQNQQSLKQILLNLQTLTASLANNNHKLDLILDNTAMASKQLTPFIQSSIGTMKVLETQTLPATYRLISNLDEISQTMSQVANELKQNPSILIRGSAQPTLGPGERK